MPTHRIIISSLPASRFAITDIQYRFDGGSATSLGGNTPGTYNITLPGTDHLVEIRAVSSAGPGPWSVAEYTDFNVAANNLIFPAGQVGGYIDPYDLTKMWVDDAGTTPATIASLGTGIGRVVTKGHTPITLVQANAADRPVWGRHPVSGIRNLQIDSGNFALWTTSQEFTANNQIAPDGTLTASTLSRISGGPDGSLTRQSIAIASGVQRTFSVIAKHLGAAQKTIVLTLSTSGPHPFGGVFRRAVFNLETGVVSEVNSPATATITPDPRGGGWFICTITDTSTTSGNHTAGISASFNSSVAIAEAQLEDGPSRTTYQRVTNRFDITEVGSPSLYYFSFNGVNQSWASNATVDFSGTDKVTVWVGLRKLSDAASGALVELSGSSTAQNGAFGLFAPSSAGSYRFISRITTASSAGTGTFAAAPDTAGIVGEANSAGPLVRLIRNNAIIESNSSSQGTGNYGNHTLNIGRRNGASNPLNGLIYSLIVAGDNYDTRTIQRFSDYGLKPRRLITA
jgi:hypothetical protein